MVSPEIFNRLSVAGNKIDFRFQAAISEEFNVNSMPVKRLTSEVKKAGFDIDLELNRRRYLQSTLGEEEGNRTWILGVTDQVIEHAYEYSAQDIVRFPPAYVLTDGKLFSPRFQQFAQDLVNPKEREGSVLAGIVQVEKKLTNALPGSFVIWVSPDGPLGIKDLKYDYSWTHVFSKAEGDEIAYVSLRTDFTPKEHVDFLNLFLGVNDKIVLNQNFQMRQIRQIMESPVVATSGMGVNSFAQVAEYLGFIRVNFGGMIYKPAQGTARFNSEIVHTLEDLNRLKTWESQAVSDVVAVFETTLQKAQNDEVRTRLIAQYLLGLNSFIRNGYKQFISLGNFRYDLLKMIQKGITGKLVDSLQKVSGCAGGLLQNTTTFTSRQNESNMFTCPKCGYATESSVGNMCPGCNITKETWSKMTSGQVCD